MARDRSVFHRLRRAAALTMVVVCAAGAARACTLFAAQGSRVAGGGTLMVKVRDWTPMDRQELVVMRPVGGYAYFALNTGGQDPGLKAGINEKGLMLESATAGSIPKENREEAGRTTGLLRKLLTGCASVDEVLAQKALFRGPRFLLAGDATQVATIEIGPGGQVRVDLTRNGVTAHTNHYLPGSLALANQRNPGGSSLSRFARIQELLNGQTPHTLEGFLAFSRDQHAGPNLSIFRTGLTPRGTRTMAVWAVRLEPGGGGEVVVRLLNAGEPEQTVRRDLATLFRKPGAGI